MNRPNARIACQTPDGSVVRARLADLDALREFLRLHPEAREYFLDLDGRTYHLQPAGDCPDWDDPRLSLVDGRYRIPPALPLTELSDISGFTRAHPNRSYRLEIDGRALTVEDVGRFE